MHTTVAFFEAAALAAAAFEPVAAVADQHIRVVGDDIQVPTLSQIVAAAFGLSQTTAIGRMRLSSPSLRERALFEPGILNVAATDAVPMDPQRVVDLRKSPLQLVVGEQINAEVLSTAALAQERWAILMLSAGPIEPVAGPIFSVRTTGAATLVAGAWVNGALTFTEDLPRGRYKVVGMRAESTGLVAARLVFVGGGWRPGVLGSINNDDKQHSMFRFGGLGEFGEFEDIEPPTVDFLSISADTAEVVTLDLIQVRKGPA